MLLPPVQFLSEAEVRDCSPVTDHAAANLPQLVSNVHPVPQAKLKLDTADLSRSEQRGPCRAQRRTVRHPPDTGLSHVWGHRCRFRVTAGVVFTDIWAIMVTVFGAFVLEDAVFLKLAGIGLATAVFVDATVVRMVLVPATMELLGDRNWWLPRWIDRVLPRLDVEGETAGTGAAAPPEREPEPLSAE